MGEGCGGCLEVSHQVTNVVDAAVTWDKVAWQCCREVVLPVIPLELLGSLRSLKYACVSCVVYADYLVDNKGL